MPMVREIDRVLLGAAMVTATAGVVMVASASGPLARQTYALGEYEFALRQLFAVGLGIVGMLAFTFVPLDKLLAWKYALPVMVVTWITLLIPYFQGAVNGTHRWLQLPLLSLQPSALAKVTLPLALAAFIGWRREARKNERSTHMIALAMTFPTVLVVLAEPDLGSAILLLVAAVAVLLLADMPWRFIPVLGGVTVLLVAAAIAAKPYRIERVRAFFGETGFQVQQSMIAIGSGGMVGRGPGESLQKLFFLPQPHTDFIFAVLGEELGFLGSIAVLGLLGVIVARGFRAARHAHSLPAALLASGLATTLAVQTLINVSVCLNLMPAKGLPLPLVSAGGSDVALTMVAIGLLINVGKEGT